MISKNLYILFLLTSAFSLAQVNMYSKINTRETRLNSPLVFTVVLEIVGEDLVQETPMQLPDFSKFNFDYVSEQNTIIDPIKKIRVNQMVCQISLDPKQTGNIKIGSALVKVNGKIYKTEPIDIVVKDAEKKAVAASSPAKNMYLNMQVSDRDVYKNEPVVAVIKAFSRNISGFRHLEPAHFEPTKNFAIRAIADVDESIETSVDDFSSQVVAMFVIVPKVVGYVELPTADVALNNHRGTLVSNKVKINVKKLPDGAPQGFKNAVGKYNLSVELVDKKKESFEINKAFNIAVKVEGKGNLSPSILPKILPSSDYDTYAPKLVNNSIATTDGLEGSVEAQYVIIPKKRGGIKIQTEHFSFFDPKLEKYVDVGPGIIALNAVNAQDIANSKTTLEKVNEYTNNVLETVNSPVISTQNLKVENKHGFNWRGILGNFLIIAVVSSVFIYFYRKYRKKQLLLANKKTVTDKPIVTIAETEALLRRKNKPDLDLYYDYQEKMIDQSNSDKFFYSVEELKSEADLYCTEQFSQNFQDYLKDHQSTDLYQRYVDLLSQINTEKYSPFSSQEKQRLILKEIKEIFSVL